MKQNVVTMFRCFNNNAGLEARRNSAVGAFHRNPFPSAHSLSAKNAILRMILVCLLVGFCTTASAAFKHYKGVHGQDYMTVNGHEMQRVAEYHYYYYVKDANETVKFDLPLELWPNGNTGADLEPHAYFRWYNYNTDDGGCSNGTLAAVGGRNTTKLSNSYGGGLIAYNLTEKRWQSISGIDPTQNGIGAKYTTNKNTTINEDWEGDVVACDVSRYFDYQQSGSNFTEPTLSIRYVFHVLPAQKLANDIKSALINGANGTSTNLTYEDNKRIIVGLKDGGKFNLRVNLDKTIKKYYFYPLTQNTAWNKHVYYDDDSKKFTESDFSTTMMSNAYDTQYDGTEKFPILWRVYDETKSMYKDLNIFFYNDKDVNKGYVYPFDRSNLSTSGWTYVSKEGTPTTPTTFNKVYVVAMLIGKNGNYCPIANYEVVFTDEYPKTYSALNKANSARLIKNLENNYKEAMTPITFDFNTDNVTKDNNHYTGVPSGTDWENNSYGYVYNMDHWTSLKQTYPTGTKHSPFHGDYGYYKSAQLNGISVSAQNGYTWHFSSSGTYDFTHDTDASKYGYFLYIDAADESRTITTATFNAYLCTGSQIIFSGHVAEMTGGNSQKAQIMFKLYGVKSDKTRTLIQSFSSGDLSTNTDDGTENYRGKWYQIYGKFTLPEGVTPKEYQSYAIDIVNMCAATNGADYAVDDIRIYTSTSMAEVIPDRVLCPEKVRNGETSSSMDEVKYKIRVNYETIQGKQSSETTKKVYYRFVEENNNPETPATGVTYGNGEKTYGVADVPTSYDKEAKLGEADGNYTQFENNGEYLVLAYRHFNLQEGKKYYLSVAYQTDQSGEPYNWGTTGNVCDIHSDVFTIKRQELKVSGETTLPTDCETGSIKKGLEVEVSITTYDSEGHSIDLSGQVPFDWFISKKSEKGFSEIEGLQEALKTFRTSNPSATSLGKYNNDLLRQYVNINQLIISGGSKLSDVKYITEPGTYVITAVATLSKVGDYGICDVMEFEVVVESGKPQLILGMPDVDNYPEGNRVIRIGLPQIKKVLADGTGVLNIPVKQMPDGTLKWTAAETAAITFGADDNFTNDPTATNYKSQGIAQVSESTLAWNNDGTVLPIKFNTGADSKFHEGYYYDLNVEFKKENATETDCAGSTTFRLLIVPEYLTWTGSEGNANWNNDKNWTRSEKSEIFKDDYTDYESNPAKVAGAYVPMKFSKVTVKELAANSSTLYPSLAGVTKDQTSGIITEMKDGYGNANATENIQYDMMVTWNKNGTNYSGADDANGTFSCEKFYANTCEQIYFKPRAELLGQQYLTYEKAWVEKELPVNKWTVMSSPLRESYAGELYVPYATGQQKTEAFKDITFNETSNGRTKYPVYQRNWDCQGKEVLDASTSYDAYDHADQTVTLDKDNNEDKLSVDVAYWSHVYNKVDEKYDAAKGFAVRAGDQYYPNSSDNSSVYTNGEAQPAIVRLPKADSEYTYYDYEGNASSSVKATISKTNGAAYKLLVDADQNTDGSYTETLTNSHNDNQYYLVGNPYAAAINLGAFFKNSDNNSAFETTKAWRLKNGVMTAVDKVSSCNIEPMEAFFVKTSNAKSSSVTAKFTADMQVDVNNTSTANPAKTRASENSDDNETFVMTASSAKSNMQTRASVVVSSSASNDFENDEDVETLYNGDLEDAPTVYTVAGNQAVALNAVADVTLIPMGVVSKTAEDVNIVIEKSEGASLYLYDAQTKTSTLLASGDNITVKSNAHGRYFLSGKAIDINDRTNSDVQIYSPANGIITVATTASDVMQGVEVFSADGKKVAQDAISGDTSKDFYVSGGLYIVKVKTADGTKTQKVAVK